MFYGFVIYYKIYQLLQEPEAIGLIPCGLISAIMGNKSAETSILGKMSKKRKVFSKILAGLFIDFFKRGKDLLINLPFLGCVYEK